MLLICGPIAIGYYLLRAFVPIPPLPVFCSTEMYIMKPLTDALANITMSLFLLSLFHKMLHHKNAPALVNHLSGHINQYYCFSYVLIAPFVPLIPVARNKLLSGTIVPLLYGLAVLIICYSYISWVDKKKLPTSISKLKGTKKVVAYTVVWALTIAIVAFVYPHITEYATIWNNYLRS